MFGEFVEAMRARLTGVWGELAGDLEFARLTEELVRQEAPRLEDVRKPIRMVEI